MLVSIGVGGACRRAAGRAGSRSTSSRPGGRSPRSARRRDRPLADRRLVPGRAADSSAALLSNAVHFGSDLLSTLAVIGGLLAARRGFPEGDSIAALFVAVLVVAAAARLIRRNVDVLMDRAPADAGGGRARGDRPARPAGRGPPAPSPPGRRPHLRRRRDRRLARAPPSGRAMRRRTGVEDAVAPRAARQRRRRPCRAGGVGGGDPRARPRGGDDRLARPRAPQPRR